MKKQVRVVYKGTVQGVGFRFTAEHIANELGVTGWVKNLVSGDVEIVGEQDEEVLKDFISKVNKYFSRYIKDVNIEWGKYTGKFTAFGISF